ncbi:MAG TPA: FG-GAP-like repeat-containing protein [bacterium]
MTRQFAGVDIGATYAFRADPQFCDLDADGDFDLFTGTGYGQVQYWQNIGTSTQAQFTRITDSLGNINAYGQSHPAFCDIDADNDFDLFIGDYFGIIEFYRNDGDSANFDYTFVTYMFDSIDVGAYANPTFCDIDADGDFDLFVGGEWGTVWQYRNDGTAGSYNFTLVTSNFLNLDVGQYATPVFADVDDDGDLDFFCGCEAHYFGWGNEAPDELYYYENVGSATAPSFQEVTRCYTQLDMGWMTHHCLVDIDADGDLDIFTSLVNWLREIENVGDSSSPAFLVHPENFPNVSVPNIFPFFADVDGDGDYDLIAGEGVIPGTPNVWLYANHGTPQQPDLQPYSSAFVTGNFDITAIPRLADIDADGDLDLFISDNGGHFFYYQNQGTPQWPNFVFQSDNWQGMGSSGVPRYGHFVDLDHDSDYDFIASSDSGTAVVLFRNQGTPANAQMVLELGPFVTPDIPGQWLYFTAPFAADIDADNDEDLFVGNTDEGIFFFRNVTGEASAPPPAQQHPRAGLQISLGPNPANPLVAASFELRVASNMSLDVFDLLGRRVAELASGFHLPGEYRYVWDASGKAAGMYFVRLRAGEARLIEKVVILK